jgi:hypothetical protein
MTQRQGCKMSATQPSIGAKITHHDPEIKLLDKADLFRVCLLGSTSPISLRHLRRLLILKNAIDMRKLGRLTLLVSSGSHYCSCSCCVGEFGVKKKIFVEVQALYIYGFWTVIFVGGGE